MNTPFELHRDAIDINQDFRRGAITHSERMAKLWAAVTCAMLRHFPSHTPDNDAELSQKWFDDVVNS